VRSNRRAATPVIQKVFGGEIFAELKKNQTDELTNGKFMVSEITKKQRTLYKRWGGVPMGT